MNEYLLQMVSDWHGGEIRPVLHAAPVPGDYLHRVERRVERRTGRRARRSSDHASHGAVAPPETCLLGAALEKLNRGVLILDADGRVLFSNRTANHILHGRNGIALRHHQLAFADPTAAAAFDELLEQGEGSLVLRIDGPSADSGTYRVLVSSLDTAADGGGYCVFIYEPDGGRRPLPELVLRNLYDLTAAEVRLTNSLFMGVSLHDAAAALGVSINTAKSTLKRVFSKCEVGSQAELLQLLSLGPRTL